MLVPIWVWILVGTIVLGGLATGAYFLFFKGDGGTDSVFNSVTVSGLDSSKSKLGTLAPNDTVRLTLDGTPSGSIVWSFTSDGGSTFTTIAENTSKTIEYQLPNEVFSDTCFVRVSDSTNTSDKIDSNTFSVVPKITLFGPGSNPEDKLLVGTQVSFPVQTSSWPLLTKGDVKLEIRVTGDATFSPVTSVEVDRNHSAFIWHTSEDLQDKQMDVRVSTTKLVAQGYPRELIARSQYPVQVVAKTGHGESLAGTFQTLNVIGQYGQMLTEIPVGGTIRLSWTSTSPIESVIISWSTSANSRGTTLVSGFNGQAGSYITRVPSSASVSLPLYFWVVDSSDDSNVARTHPIRVIQSWEIYKGSQPELNVTVHPNEWHFSVFLKISGFSSSYGDATQWTNTLSFPGIKGSSNWEVPSSALQVHPEIAAESVYNFVYTVSEAPPLMAQYSDGLDFVVNLSYDNGTPQATPYQYHATSSTPTEPTTTNKSFTSIVYLNEFDPTNPKEANSVSIPDSLMGGGTYYFGYTGVNIGSEPVQWQLIYTTSDAGGSQVDHNLLAAKPDNTNTTQGNQQWLGIKFPPNLITSDARIRVRLPAVSTSVAFTSASFAVVPEVNFMPLDESTVEIYDEYPTTVRVSATGGLPDNLFGDTVTYQFRSQVSGTDTWDEETGVVVDKENMAFVWTPSGRDGEDRLFRATTTNLVTAYNASGEVDITSTATYSILSSSSSQELLITTLVGGNKVVPGGRIIARVLPQNTLDGKSVALFALDDNGRTQLSSGYGVYNSAAGLSAVVPPKLSGPYRFVITDADQSLNVLSSEITISPAIWATWNKSPVATESKLSNVFEVKVYVPDIGVSTSEWETEGNWTVNFFDLRSTVNGLVIISKITHGTGAVTDPTSNYVTIKFILTNKVFSTLARSTVYVKCVYKGTNPQLSCNTSRAQVKVQAGTSW